MGPPPQIMSGKLHWSEKRQFLDGFLEFAHSPNAALVSFVVAKGDGKTPEANLR
jgi:hypothetical protein